MAHERMRAFGAKGLCNERHDGLAASDSARPMRKMRRFPARPADHDAAAHVSYCHCLRTIVILEVCLEQYRSVLLQFITLL